LSGPGENRPPDAVVMAARRTKILRLVRLTEYSLEEKWTLQGAGTRITTLAAVSCWLRSAYRPTNLDGQANEALLCEAPADDRLQSEGGIRDQPILVGCHDGIGIARRFEAFLGNLRCVPGSSWRC
jgi:hypothetical protein